MRYFSFILPATGEYVEIEIRINERLQKGEGYWCENKVLVSYDMFRNFPAGDNQAVKNWFARLQIIEMPELLQLESY